MGIFDKLVSTPKPGGAGGGGGPPSYTQANNTSTNPYPSTYNNQAGYHPYDANNGSSLGGPSAGAAGTDQRPLPPGWEKQWHDGYQRYFYVDTRAPNGPQSHWIHPIDQQQQQQQQSLPAGAEAGRLYNPPPPSNHPYYPSQPQPAGYQQPMYQHQPMPVGQPAPNPRRAGGGMNPLLAGAGGLAGGMLLGSMLEGHHHHHQDHNYMDGYEQGYENGYDNGFENGDEWGGGGDDWGGGGDFF
ncbi:hypothetical protein PGT21_011039 [Puccinia graminis f. sp. tritici]|uniref:WW domain-containing protein n=1 Tax=Puccinia graminis f. sp. tritici TaxID=56615 RepID=A0A5B0NBX4_PUCGR|nr:hypothetical protein PGT21_011039 [Puccinia graminis f. sp. tritici]